MERKLTSAIQKKLFVIVPHANALLLANILLQSSLRIRFILTSLKRPHTVYELTIKAKNPLKYVILYYDHITTYELL